MKEVLNSMSALAPLPVVLVSCGSLEKSNITTVAWTGIINSNPMMLYVSMRPTRYSNEIIKNTKEFVINLPNSAQVVESDLCGTKSGRDIDKFKECNFTKSICKTITAPYIKECPINIECKVEEIKKLGSHDMFIAKVLSVNVDKELVDSNKNILYEKANLMCFAGKKYFESNKEIGYRGICLK